MHFLWFVCWLVTAVLLVVLERRKRKLSPLDYVLAVVWPFVLLLDCATQAVMDSHPGKHPEDFRPSPWFPRVN